MDWLFTVFRQVHVRLVREGGDDHTKSDFGRDRRKFPFLVNSVSHIIPAIPFLVFILLLCSRIYFPHLVFMPSSSQNSNAFILARPSLHLSRLPPLNAKVWSP